MKQQVPWAPYRMALVLWSTGIEMWETQWRESVAVPEGAVSPDGDVLQDGWLWWSADVMFGGDSGCPVWDHMLAGSARTALLPDQCPHCYEVDDHAPDCAAPHYHDTTLSNTKDPTPDGATVRISTRQI